MLHEALRAGLMVDEFWSLTPREVEMVMRARWWRQEQVQEMESKRMLATAWHTARLMRARRMPSLNRLLNPPRTRPLSAREAAERQREFDTLTKAMGGGRG